MSPEDTNPRGWFAIGVFHPKTGVNVGTLWRSAHAMGAAFTFSIGPRFPDRALPIGLRASHATQQDPALDQRTDTMRSDRHMPYLRFESVDALLRCSPLSVLVGVELDDRARPLARFAHPQRAIYLLGAEDHGLSPQVRDQCDRLVQLPGNTA